MQTNNQILRYLAARVGTGDHAAFRCLYAMLAPTTLAGVRDDLPDVAHSMHVVRATFTEVWWMCAFDARCGTPRRNVARWVAAIAERRRDERRLALDAARNMPPAVQTAFWTGLLAEHDSWTRFQLAALLDGHDTIDSVHELVPDRRLDWGAVESGI